MWGKIQNNPESLKPDQIFVEDIAGWFLMRHGDPEVQLSSGQEEVF